jgi:uracil-DNA glycosylase
VYPSAEDVFRAFELTPLVETKVVIIGQDPYHSPGQADGLCFSIRAGPPFPRSLTNILKELKVDKGCPVPSTDSLEAWARQGVLMLNVILTVCESMAESHALLGWESFTDEVIKCVRRERDPVFILWGCKPMRWRVCWHRTAGSFARHIHLGSRPIDRASTLRHSSRASRSVRRMPCSGMLANERSTGALGNSRIRQSGRPVRSRGT